MLQIDRNRDICKFALNICLAVLDVYLLRYAGLWELAYLFTETGEKSLRMQRLNVKNMPGHFVSI